MLRSFRRLLSISCLSFAAFVAFAGEPAKRPLTHADYDSWKSIAASTLTRDGKWLAYSYMPQEGDGEIVLRELATQKELRVAIGALPPAPTGPSEENPERPNLRREATITFTGDGKFAVATAFPNLADTLAAKRAKKKADDLPKEGLVVVNLASGETTRVANVKNFQVPAKGSAWLAYLKNPAPEKPAGKPAESPAKTDVTAKPEATPAKKDKDKKNGSDLVLRNLASGTDRTFANVLEYSFARDGRTLVFTVSTKDGATDGVFAVTPGDAAEPVAILTGSGNYQKLTWDRPQTQLAFISDKNDRAAKTPKFAAYHWARGSGAATEVVNASTAGVPVNSSVSADAALFFSFNGGKLVVSTALIAPEVDERIEKQLDEERVNADLWHWNDDTIQPLQKIRSAREKRRAYLGVYDLASKKFTQLADESLASVTLSDDGARAFGYDDRAYRKRLDYDGGYQDAHLLDATTGKRRLALRELGERAGLRWSPNNRWLAYFADNQWFALDATNAAIIPLTKSLPVAFHDEENDLPQDAPSYGSVGWTQDGESLIIYDRYDVWQVFPDGRAAKNLTAGHGRAQKIELRVQIIEPNEPEDDSRGLDPAKPLVLRGESEVTRASGFFRTTFTTSTAPERLVWADKNYRFLSRARDADTLVLTASRFDEYPDLLTTNAAFKTLVKVSQGGAQLAPFAWGSGELMTFRNTDGVELAAALYKPANFDPKKKYPVIVYLYERFSQNVHSFVPPAPGQNINAAVYTSNGYLVLMPDIAYTIGYPGQSAMKCILPAVDALVARGCVDENAIGIQGHSWGGYQIAYMVTQTNRFRAAEAGAIVANMTSAYSGIRWGSGRARQFQYEKTQSRIGRSLSEAPHLYIENSPLFSVNRVTTPLLLLHNDQDDAVPWQQGIEFFLALRRLGKEVYLFNYNNGLHGLRRRADLEDYSKRLQQYFDHFLKGAPAPEWLKSGIPYNDRDAEKLRFRDQN
ncbi:prolyl oligopeptidase family serine peptidase [Oleiharenicola lentus]|uniref:S9 family peptidase n=1 Tax=Oleiharenicola lentus TaxID=2508720 RepID=UPI003F666EE5